jgi:hypothetical protein
MEEKKKIEADRKEGRQGRSKGALLKEAAPAAAVRACLLPISLSFISPHLRLI